MSTNRRAISWRIVFWGTALQVVFAFLVLLPDVRGFFFDAVDKGIKKLLSFAEDGANFTFQSVHPHKIEALDFSTQGYVTQVYAGKISPAAKSLFTWVLPTIIFFSSLMALLYHVGIMQRIVKAFAWIMFRTMKTSGAETLSASANIFLGQTEAPLLIRPFVGKMTDSELHCVMVGGFATVAGGVMGVYVGALQSIDGIAGHIMTASIMSAPAAIVCAKIMVPETGTPATSGALPFSVEKVDRNAVEAVSRGASDGMALLLNVAAMLIAFVALVALANYLISAVGGVFGAEVSLQKLLGWLFTPLAFLMGVPWDEAGAVGQLLGEKMILTELIAYFHLGEMVNQATPVLSYRSSVIASYALCGFANLASIGIQIGGIGGIAPERRGDLAKLGFRAMISGSLACNMTGTIAGAFVR
ncbi:MAG: NupC/NupG family nucleoside CNT transporter [Deltaproteobacteria bacterium]|nr:NupC/NupG family nucleoside CNT transporter [Deltaproteobacteria bacterium]